MYVYFWINQTFHLPWHDCIYACIFLLCRAYSQRRVKRGEFSPAKGWQYDYLSYTLWNLDPKSRLNSRSIPTRPGAARDALSEESPIFIYISAFSAECGCIILDFVCLMGAAPSM